MTETLLARIALDELLQKDCFGTPNEPCADKTCAYNIGKNCYYEVKELPPVQSGEGCFDYNLWRKTK